MEHILKVWLYWAETPVLVETVTDSCVQGFIDIAIIAHEFGATAIELISCTVRV